MEIDKWISNNDERKGNSIFLCAWRILAPSNCTIVISLQILINCVHSRCVFFRCNTLSVTGAIKS